jgi:hypothetical protein
LKADHATNYYHRIVSINFAEHAMLRTPTVAFIIALLSAGLARAQITPITSGLPDRGYNYGYSLSPDYERPITAQDMREMEIERRYNETLKKIPNKKPSNDPWSGVRPAPVADRLRPQ